MNGFMYKVARFFQGRYGIDKLFYGICGVAVVLSADAVGAHEVTL